MSHCGRCGSTIGLEPHACLLPALWWLRGVEVESLCRGVLEEQLVRSSMQLGPADYDEALSFLLGEVVVLSPKYDASRERTGGTFRGFLYDRLRFRLIDYWRSWYGRRGQHRVHDGDAGVDRLELDSGGGLGDAADDWLPAFGGRQQTADRPQAGALGERGRPADRVAEGGTARALGQARGSTARAGGPASPPYLDCLSCGWRTYRQAPNGKPGWHFPEACPACGGDLDQKADAAGGDGGNTSLAKAPGVTAPEGQTCLPAATATRPRRPAFVEDELEPDDVDVELSEIEEDCTIGPVEEQAA